MRIFNRRPVIRVGAAFFAYMVLSANTGLLRAHEHEHTHRKLTVAAFRLLNHEFFRQDPMGEAAILLEIAQGAVDEDNCIGMSLGRDWQFHANFQSHFNPIPDLPVLPFPGCSLSGFQQMNARDRAELLWGWALADFRSGNRRSAYRILGRVLHLLQDMTSPAHVHNDPHGQLNFTACGGDSDDFERWGHCDSAGLDFISDYVNSGGTASLCQGTGVPISIRGDTTPRSVTCRLWWGLKLLFDGQAQGGFSSRDPVEVLAGENSASAFVRHVSSRAYSYTTYRVRLKDDTFFTDVQDPSELRAMLRGSGSSNCGAGVIDVGLCDIGGGWSISGQFQEVGFSDGFCGRSEGAADINEEWWVMPQGCTRTVTRFGDIFVTGDAYIENAGGEGPQGFATGGFIPLRYGCTAADRSLCGDSAAGTLRSKPWFQQLYGTITNQVDPFVPVANTSKTLLRIYGDAMYPLAVAFSAGLIESFIEEVRPTCQYHLTPSFASASVDGASKSAAVATTAVCSWRAVTQNDWITITSSDGHGAGLMTFEVAPNPNPETRYGTISIANTQTLLVAQAGSASDAPFGFFDTPLENSSGLSGAVPFTGWALDDVLVERVTVCRDAVAGESAPVDPRCGGAAQIFVDEPVFIDGARPDIQAQYPTYPGNNLAGWGFMVHTNMLPNQGNGTFVFSTYLRDLEGHVVLLGTRTISCDNATATAPFGTIDTPTQGGSASGTIFNFGWALTPQPKIIPFDGSTIVVFVDGVPIGSPSYNHFRPDIAGLFPGLANSGGPVGVRTIDTTTLTNGVHTIAWSVTDNMGAATGIGSRFWTVQNNPAPTTSRFELGALEVPVVSVPTSDGREPVEKALSRAAVDRLPSEGRSMAWRRGWDLEAPFHRLNGRIGGVTLRGEEIDRFELHFAGRASDRYVGYLRVGNALSPLPLGSQLDPVSGVFTWAPGAGFVGTYDLVFVRSVGGMPTTRREVRIELWPKGMR